MSEIAGVGEAHDDSLREAASRLQSHEIWAAALLRRLHPQVHLRANDLASPAVYAVLQRHAVLFQVADDVDAMNLGRAVRHARGCFAKLLILRDALHAHI